MTKITYRQILLLAAPIYGGMLAQTLTGIVDTAFLGQVGLVQQSAAGYAALFYLVFFVMGMGFTLGTQILIARRIGEGRTSEVGPIFYRGILFMIGYASLVFLFFRFGADLFMKMVTNSEQVGKLTAEYLRTRAFGVFATMLNLCFMAYYVGKGKSVAISISAIVSSIVNICLGYVLIFGKMGFPRMEVDGAALAAAVADITGTLAFIIFTLFQRDLQKLGFGKWSGASMQEILFISVPLILQNMISILAWFIFFTLIEKTGEENFGISIIARSVYSIFMMTPISLGSATNSLVSNLIGQKRHSEVLPLIRKTTLFSAGFMALTLLVLIVFPKSVFMIFTPDAGMAQNALKTVVVVVLALFAFSISNISYQAVSGTGKTRVALIIECSCIACYVVYAAWATNAYPGHLWVIWIAEVLYMVLFGISAYGYMRSRRWIER